MPLDGVLVVDKPEGPTSFDVVARVRRALKEKKAGHTGTLDPMATGVLAVCLGGATRLVPFLTDGDKVYEAVARLGAATDTQDRLGKVVAEAPVNVTDAQVREACAALVGTQQQLPPMFSAVRVDGKRLYEIAREGGEVERDARSITVHAFEVLGFDGQELAFRVRCSKGTFVRTLAHDLGEKLGCHAHLVALRRTETGGLGLPGAVTLEDLEKLPREQIVAKLIAPREALRMFPELVVDAAAERKVKQGMRLGLKDAPKLAQLSGRLRVTSSDGRLLAVAEMQPAGLSYLRVLA